MKPEYLRELADLADPDELWRRPGLEYIRFTTEQRQQVDAGVALRRYASHIQKLNELLVEKRSLLITPISLNSSADCSVDTPYTHERLRRMRDVRLAPDTTGE